LQLLEVHNVTKKFGGLVALKHCTLRVEKGAIKGLIGPNGAGKTTLINVISGFLRPDKGEIYFKNKRIDGLKPYQLAKMGIARTFQVPKPFRHMTLLDNLIAAGITPFKNRKELENKAIELLKFFDLYRLKDQFGDNLSGGQKKLLEMARTLIFDPDLIMLDEPFHGIHPNFKAKIVKAVRKLSEEGKTFIVVSHDVPTISKICEDLVVLCAGEVIAEGTLEEVESNPKVREAYLGV